MTATAQQTDPAPAATPASAPAPKVDLSGNVDTYCNYNFNRPDSVLNQLTNCDTQANRPGLSMARFSVERQTGMVGFRVDLGTGRGYDVFRATEPDLGSSIWRPIPQAYASLRPVKGKSVQIDVGKFYTSAGAEVTDTHLNWNYSRSLLFANGPYSLWPAHFPSGYLQVDHRLSIGQRLKQCEGLERRQILRLYRRFHVEQEGLDLQQYLCGTGEDWDHGRMARIR